MIVLDQLVGITLAMRNDIRRAKKNSIIIHIHILGHMVRFDSRLFTVLSILFVINYDNYGLDESCPKWITSTYYFVLCLLSLCDSEHGIKCRTKSRNMKLMWLLIRSLLLLFFSSSQIQSRYKQKKTPYYLHIRWVTQTLWFRWALDLFLFIFVFLYSLSLPSTKSMSIAWVLHCIALHIFTHVTITNSCAYFYLKNETGFEFNACTLMLANTDCKKSTLEYSRGKNNNSLSRKNIRVMQCMRKKNTNGFDVITLMQNENKLHCFPMFLNAEIENEHTQKKSFCFVYIIIWSCCFFFSNIDFFRLKID